MGMRAIISQLLGLSAEQTEQLLNYTPNEIMALPEIQHAIGDTSLLVLQASLPQAQQALEQALPEFYAWLKRDLGVDQPPALPNHAIEWVSDFLVGRRRVSDLILAHASLTSDTIEQAGPRFIAMFDQLSFGRAEWQRATTVLVLLLLAAARESARAEPSHST